MDEQLTLTLLLEPIDDIDEFILQDIQMIVRNSSVLPIVSFWGHSKLNMDKADEVFFKKIGLVVTALCKANAHRRNYHKIKDDLIEQIKNDPQIQGTNVDMLFNKVDAFIIIEGFFSQIKSSLDLLAQSLNPIFGINFHTYKRKLDQASQRKLSGLEIVNSLENRLKTELRSNAAAIIELIRKNMNPITDIVKHRDSTIHYGENKKIQGFRYSVSKREIFPPIILVNPTESAFVHEYMDEVMKYIAEYAQEFVITILSNLMEGMIIAKRDDGSWGYSITNLPK